MINRIGRIRDEFDIEYQVELDLLVYDYLEFLSKEQECSLLDIPIYYKLDHLRYMIERYTSEVQKIWKENEKRNY